MDNLILPILNDFKTDFIVNSAGQDNHYTDPLGSMRITAQGYARLTEKLRPDLAVLEGGYAIETALPYVNMAIILALAGLDYSGVREPDYWPGRFKERAGVAAGVERLVDELLQRWERRDRVSPDAKRISGNYYTRNKRIFYDTDYIEEEQIEQLRLCDNCPGYLVIDSDAKHGYGRSGRALCISVPHAACGRCRGEAAELYGRSRKDSQYDYIYLQDKHDDIFYGYSTDSDHEWRSEG